MSNQPTTLGADSLSPEDVRRKRAATITGLLITFLIAPIAVITALVTYSLVGIGRNKPKVVYTAYALIAGALLISAVPFLSINWMGNLFTDSFHAQTEGTIDGVTGYLFILIKFYLLQVPIDIIIGGFFGCLYTMYRMFFRDRWKETDFKPTPIQKLKEKKNRQQIQQDTNSPEAGRTIGIETYRRFPPVKGKKNNKNIGNNFHGEKVIQSPGESAAHTLILGAAGSGKALDVRTPIMTSEGYVSMGDLEAGNLVVHPTFNLISIDAALDIQKDKESYVFNFSDGSQITSDKEHIWSLLEGNFTSEEVVEVFDQDKKIQIQTATKKPVEFNTNISTPNHPFLIGSMWHLDKYTVHGGSQGSYLSGEWVNRGSQLTLDKQKGVYSHELTYSDEDFDALLNGTLSQREELLKGVLYSGAAIVSLDETYQGGINFPVFSYEAYTKNDADKVIMLATSLGIHAISSGNTVLIEGKELEHVKFECFDIRQGYSNLLKTLINSKQVITLSSYEKTVADVRCIKVGSEDGLFVAGTSSVPTHNTTTLLLQSRDIIKQGEGFAFIDLKGGDDVVDGVYEYCQRYGIRMHHWTLQDSYLPYEGPIENGPAYYDPITRGDPSRRKDLILSLRKWDAASDVYKKASASYIQTLFNVIYLSPNTKVESTLNDVINLMQSPEKLMARLDQVPPEKRNKKYDETRQTVKYMMTSTNKVVKDSIKTTQETLQIFSQSIAGPWLGQDPEGKEDINLWEIADKGEVIVFSLDSSNYPELSQDIANLIIQDLKTASSEFRQNPPKNRLNVFIDEFASIESDNLVQLVNKCRDANIPVSFATQTLADMKTVSDTFADQLNGIISSFIIHRVNSEDDAQEYSGIFGKEDKAKVMEEVEHSSGLFGGIGRGSATGKGRVTYEKDYIVPIEKLQEMAVGQAVYHTKATNSEGISSRTYYVSVIPEMLGDNKAVKRKSAQTEEREKKMALTSFSGESATWEELESDNEEEHTNTPEEYQNSYEYEEEEESYAPEQSRNEPVVERKQQTMTNNDPEYGDDSYLGEEFENESVGEIRYTGKTSDITSLINLSAISSVEKGKISNMFKRKKKKEAFSEDEFSSPKPTMSEPATTVPEPVASSPKIKKASRQEPESESSVWDTEEPLRKKAPKKKEPKKVETSPEEPTYRQAQDKEPRPSSSAPERPSRPTGMKRPVRPSGAGNGSTSVNGQEPRPNVPQSPRSKPQRPSAARAQPPAARAQSPAPNKRPNAAQGQSPLPKKRPAGGQLPPLKKKPVKKIDTDEDGNKFSW